VCSLSFLPCSRSEKLPNGNAPTRLECPRSFSDFPTVFGKSESCGAELPTNRLTQKSNRFAKRAKHFVEIERATGRKRATQRAAPKAGGALSGATYRPTGHDSSHFV